MSQRTPDIYAPCGTPQRILNASNIKINRYRKSAEGRARLLPMGLTAAGGSPQQSAEYFRIQTKSWVKVLRAAGIKNE